MNCVMMKCVFQNSKESDRIYEFISSDLHLIVYSKFSIVFFFFFFFFWGGGRGVGGGLAAFKV